MRPACVSRPCFRSSMIVPACVFHNPLPNLLFECLLRVTQTREWGLRSFMDSSDLSSELSSCG